MPTIELHHQQTHRRGESSAMRNTSIPQTCDRCRNPCRSQLATRSCDHCITLGPQAARQAVDATSDADELDQTIRRGLEDVINAAQTCLYAIDRPNTPVAELLTCSRHLQVASDRLTNDMVTRMRQRGASWEQVAAALNTTREAARTRWSQGDALADQLPIAQLAARPVGTTMMGPLSANTEKSVTSPGPRSVMAAADRTRKAGACGHDLAAVLNALYRTSGLSLQALANRCGLSAGLLCSLMAGEGFPSWKNVDAIARACGADSEVLRRVWEASALRRDSPPRSTCLTTALRFLHQRVGSPTARAIAVTSGGTLEEDLVAAILAGSATGSWTSIKRLIEILAGEPQLLLPLWQAESAKGGAPRPPMPTSTDRHTSPQAQYIEEFFTGFSRAQGAPGWMSNVRHSSSSSPIRGPEPLMRLLHTTDANRPPRSPASRTTTSASHSAVARSPHQWPASPPWPERRL
ncbi:helix-turn-helix domain-containing protein [Streptomyces sp. NPDC101209]|uniref:helix-turn-helix domain-containing protein n=1 Tax=Streptomyces sp. NPDC101209 TaxID=3366129 RepID=UPI00382F90EA